MANKSLEDYLYYEEKDPDLKIYHGDCLEILPFLDKADLVIADPPYGIGENAFRVANRRKLAKTIDYGSFDWDKEPASKQEIEATISAGKNAVIWGGNYFHLPPARGWLVWDKLNSGDFADCELAWTNLKMSVRIFRHMWNGMIRASERDRKRVHPTQKPIALINWVLSYAFEAQTIIDPFMGSGTTLVACKELNRNGIGIEINEKYCEIAKKRLKATCKPLFIDVSGAGKNLQKNETQSVMPFDAV